MFIINTEQLNLAEANSILILLDDKHTLFQVLFSEKSYASKIRSFCGGCIEVEPIVNEVHLKKDCTFFENKSNYIKLNLSNY